MNDDALPVQDIESSFGRGFRWRLITPFLIVVALLTAVGLLSAQALFIVRVYVSSEALWAKSQRDAVYQLANFIESGERADLDGFRDAIKVPLGDMRARIALTSNPPDRAAARAGYLDGGVHADDIASLIWLYQQFRGFDFMHDAVGVWSEADTHIVDLGRLADEVQTRLAAGKFNLSAKRAARLRLSALNARLLDLERNFARSEDHAARSAQRAVQWLTLSFALALAGSAGVLTLALTRRLNRSARALVSSETRFRIVLDSSQDAVLLVDAALRIRYANDAVRRVLGHDPARLIGCGIEALHARTPQGAPGGIERLLRTPPGARPAAAQEMIATRADDRECALEVTVATRGDAARGVRAVFLRDITERHRGEEARRTLEAQLRESQKMEAVGTLAGGIAHDFNNVLGGIIGNVALANAQLGPRHPAQVNLWQINKSAVRARGLVQQILEFSRRQPSVLVKRRLAPMIDEAIDLMRATLPAGVSLVAGDVDAELHAMSDAVQMQQVLINLCTNAWHAIESGIGRIELELHAVGPGRAERGPRNLPSGAYACLLVRDSGCGMDEATQARIFEPFFTTKPVGSGTGLGLSVIHGIVAAHHGAITVESAPGQGSTFRVYLPLEESAASGEPSEWVGLQPLECHGSGQRILYVDDDEVMLMMVESLLGNLGYAVTCFGDPVEALAALRARPGSFDLVVADYNMPRLSGMDLARELAASQPTLPVVISSGYLTDEQRLRLGQYGVRAFMQKQHTVEHIGAVIGRVLSETLETALEQAA